MKLPEKIKPDHEFKSIDIFKLANTVNAIIDYLAEKEKKDFDRICDYQIRNQK
tara:strand:- start:83 stop:241 length:159 start_codon:yes stop_codon:yes gene_type:complete